MVNETRPTAKDYIRWLKPLLGRGMENDLRNIALQAAADGHGPEVAEWLTAEVARRDAKAARRERDAAAFGEAAAGAIEFMNLMGADNLGEAFNKARELGYTTVPEAVEGERAKERGGA